MHVLVNSPRSFASLLAFDARNGLGHYQTSHDLDPTQRATHLALPIKGWISGPIFAFLVLTMALEIGSSLQLHPKVYNLVPGHLTARLNFQVARFSLLTTSPILSWFFL